MRSDVSQLRSCPAMAGPDPVGGQHFPRVRSSEATMTKLTETQVTILCAGAERPDHIAMPLPAGLHGAAAKMAVTRMIALGWLQEVDANRRRGDPLWRETGDGHGTTLMVTDKGLLAIGIDRAVKQPTVTIANTPSETSASKSPTPRAGTKQAMLIEMLQDPSGATMADIIVATGWQAHTVRGAMSGALGKKLGLTVTSAKEEGRGRVYRINRVCSQLVLPKTGSEALQT